MPRLRRVDCSAPGIRRRRSGRGFVYVSESGKRITDQATLNRIRELVLPPAWTDVWICPDPNGHLQAVGTDARGRRQYRYHDRWRARRDLEKFDAMLAFARRLPRMRKIATRHMHDPALARTCVLACAARLLDLGFFRVGSEGYAEDNNTFGLATILKKHVTIDGNIVTFDYPAKGGKQRVQSVVDPEVVRIVTRLKRRRAGGPELLAYKEHGRWVDVRSSDINAYLKDVIGEGFTAKDFRTWSATVLCAVALGISKRVESSSGKKRAIARAIKETAHYLGNTPAVCRSSYVDPRVIDHYIAGVTIHDAIDRIGEGVRPGALSTQGLIEDAVLGMLEEAPAPDVERAASVSEWRVSA